MKALKNESALFTSRVTGAISDCYACSSEPTDTQLMELYTLIGKCICGQGEKAYVVHLAQTLAEQFPQIKGFSPRNLRRMRDFYRAYENSPVLMAQAQTLGWTQNTVILECCETDEQRAFYTGLTAEQNLSKLALMKAIESGAFEATGTEQNPAEDTASPCAAVSDCFDDQAVDTTPPVKTACGPIVTACEPLRQGSGMPPETVAISAAIPNGFGNRRMPADRRLLKRIKRSSHAVQIRPPELMPKPLGCTVKDSLQMWLGKRLLASSSPPPQWRQGSAAACRCSA